MSANPSERRGKHRRYTREIENAEAVLALVVVFSLTFLECSIYIALGGQYVTIQHHFRPQLAVHMIAKWPARSKKRIGWVW